ncbi:MAG: diacylglycerol/lipid kinase family protein [Flavisolibacter sp.]
MHKDSILKLLFVINPISGGKEKHNWEAAIREYFTDSPHQTEFYLLTGQSDRISIQGYIDTIRPDRVVAVGGDGTVKMLAEMLKETPIPLGILPAGSANGMAKELDIPLNVVEALDVIVHGAVRKIDLIRINEEEICIHLSDVGMNALMVRYFEKSGSRGFIGYAKATFRILWQKRKFRVNIRTDKEEVKREAYMVVLANARKYGTGANINPDGDLSDGKFEIVVVRKLNLLEIFKALFTDRSFHPRRIEVFSTTSLDITIQRKTYFQVDGEYKRKTAKVHARILPGILNIMIPKDETA